MNLYRTNGFCSGSWSYTNNYRIFILKSDSAWPSGQTLHKLLVTVTKYRKSFKDGYMHLNDLEVIPSINGNRNKVYGFLQVRIILNALF